MSKEENEYERYDGPKRRREDYQENWHLDRKVPITIIIVLVAQIFAFGWWGATVEGRISHFEKMLTTKTSDRYHRAEAEAAHELLKTKIEFNTTTGTRIEGMLKDIDVKIDKIIEEKHKH